MMNCFQVVVSISVCASIAGAKTILTDPNKAGAAVAIAAALVGRDGKCLARQQTHCNSASRELAGIL
jgi:hypothetical protein